MSRDRAVSHAAAADDPVDVARPFVWIAAISFATGFWGYLAALPLLGR
ncbi:MAG TPA: hypothetical protein VKQ70_03680 [Caulobacteraceae bacterium]|jgi:hypothetical protein|nr:hypothetical protein [Caulobacteraceae bacterium]